jgi:hypothetical protein
VYLDQNPRIRVPKGTRPQFRKRSTFINLQFYHFNLHTASSYTTVCPFQVEDLAKESQAPTLPLCTANNPTKLLTDNRHQVCDPFLRVVRDFDSTIYFEVDKACSATFLLYETLDPESSNYLAQLEVSEQITGGSSSTVLVN